MSGIAGTAMAMMSAAHGSTNSAIAARTRTGTVIEARIGPRKVA
ncbi:hypothetical protein [Streptosporangium sp. NPDC002607]